MHCRIRIKGHLDSSWHTWFDYLEMVQEVEDTTQLCGPLPDQAALYGVLLTIRRLGLTLLSFDTNVRSNKQQTHDTNTSEEKQNEQRSARF